MSGSSIIALASKEVRNLGPLVFALLALEIVSLFDLFASQSPDQLSWFSLSFLFEPAVRQVSIAIFGIGAIGGYVAFSRERSERTLPFLWALPLARRHVYLIKLATVFFVLTIFLLLSQLGTWGVHAMTASMTLREQFGWHLWWLEFAVLLGMQSIGICYGLLASYFRLPGVLTLLVLVVGASMLAFVAPALDFVSIGALATPEFRGTDVVLHAEAWRFHLAAALGCAVAAGCLWTRRVDKAGIAGAPSPLLRRLAGLGAFAGALVLVIGLAASRFLPENVIGGEYGELQSIETETFVFSFYRDDRPFAELLRYESADLYRRVEALMQVQPSQKIFVDLTDESADHLGIAGWRRLRIRRTALPDSARRKHVFAHELVHVLAAESSDRRLSDHANVTKFFNEGLAEWAAYQVVDLSAKKDALDLLSAVAWQRLDLEFGDMLTWTRFSSRFDERLVYAIGLNWVSTLARVCGESAPVDALRAMADTDLPQRVGGDGLWREVLGRIGCRLDEVNSRMSTRMRDMPIDSATVPEAEGVARTDSGFVRFSVGFEGGRRNRRYKVLVRVRDNPSVGPLAIRTRSRTITENQRAEITFRDDFISGRGFEYQIGIEFLDGERPYFGPWIGQG